MRHRFKCGRASAEPNVEKVLTLKKPDCLSKASFRFLVKSFLERGNLTAVKLEARRASFSLPFVNSAALLSIEKDETR
ncbi:MAG: hypothetical protein COA44_09645 [Arcobacter sp.]|nr:MAG: hypothetical protein COA44_09645 [Arcobacter sp.]